jgi:hypothetical protein
MAEMIWKIGIDKLEALAAGKMFGKGASEGGKGGSSKGSGGGSFAGGFLGSIAGSILSSVKQLFDPLNAIASLLVAALFPILKPFLILFIKLGLLLYKWISGILGTGDTKSGVVGPANTGDGLAIGDMGKSILTWGSILGGILAAIVVLLAPVEVGFMGIAAVVLAIAGVFYGIGKFALQLGWYVGQGLHAIWLMLVIAAQWIADIFMKFIGLLGDAWSWIVTTFKEKWAQFLELLSASWEMLKKFGTWIWDGLVLVFTAAWETLKTFGTWIWDSLVAIFTTSFAALSGIGQWISDKIKSMVSSVKSLFGKGGGSGSSVQDAIITPNGDIIRTSPADYLIATKNPGSLMGGSGSSNINVTINGGMITEDVAKQIGKIISRQVKMGGGF